MTQGTRPRLIFLLKAGVSAGILILLATRVDFSSVGAAMSVIRTETALAGFAILVLQTVLTACRWSLVMDGMGVVRRLSGAVGAVYVGLLLNQCLPSYLGGDAYRVYWLRRGGAPLRTAVRGVVIDRISALFALVGMLAFTLPLVLRLLSDPVFQTGMMILTAAGIAAAIVFLSLDLLPLPEPLRRFSRPFGDLSASARSILLDGWRGVAILVLALSIQMLSGVVLHLFAAGLGMPLSLVDCVLLVAPIALVTAVPISVAGWGVREGALVGVLSLLGIPKEQALALSLLFGLTALANGGGGLLPLLLGGDRVLPTTASESDAERAPS